MCIYTRLQALCAEREGARARVREREEEISPDPLFRVAYINDHVSVCTYTRVCVCGAVGRTNERFYDREPLGRVCICISEEKREMDDDAGCSHVLWNQGSV